MLPSLKCKIQYISDIHLELLSESKASALIEKIVPQSVDVNVLILAGDIGNPFSKSYLQLLRSVQMKFTKTFVIAGNHEYYDNDIDETKMQLRTICDRFPTISFLDNTSEIYMGYKWIGTTQWSHISKPKYTINDTVAINDMTVDKYNELHAEAVQFLTSELKSSLDENKEKVIVITHHLPLDELTNPFYTQGYFAKYNQWFSADLHELIINNQSIIAVWFYGHTHLKTVQTFHNIKFYCNPTGYNNENPGLPINATMDI
jgi:predicted phosphodiesterase